MLVRKFSDYIHIKYIEVYTFPYTYKCRNGCIFSRENAVNSFTALAFYAFRGIDHGLGADLAYKAEAQI